MTVVEATSPAVQHAPSASFGTVLRWRRVSMRINVRALAVCAVVVAITAVVACRSIMVGDFPLSTRQVLSAVFGDGGEDAEFVVQTLRLPRALTAILVGAALGMSGAVFQSLTRNPLGSPDIIGFESGAALGAVFVISIVNGESAEIAIGAVGGGFVTALLVYVLAWRRGIAPSLAGPIARRLISSPSACLVPAACIGAMVMTIGDFAARRTFAPTEFPVGIATAVLGAPYLIWLLMRRARTGSL